MKIQVINHLENEQSAKLFSAWQFSYINKNSCICEKGGTYSFEDAEKINEKTLFDIASLTKVVLTAPLFYKLFYEKIILPDEQISKYFKLFKNNIKIIELLKHTSGLPSWLPFYEMVENDISITEKKRKVITIIAESGKNERSKCYSDLNFILLGFILEQISGMTLDKLFESFKNSFSLPHEITFKPSEKIPLTAYSKFRSSFPEKTVEDENCYFLGGLCGHAGLFSNSDSLINYFIKLFNINWFSETAKITEYAGFDRPEGRNSNYGINAEESHIGHLGFTGTAILIDPAKKNCASLLTNSTHPNPDKPERKEKIKKCRQIFFDEFLTN